MASNSGFKLELKAVKIDQRALRRLSSQSGDVGKWMAQLARKVTIRSKYYLSGNMVNVRTGRLRNSVTTQSTGSNPPTWIVTANTDYAYYVHELYGRPFLIQATIDVFRREGLM